MTPAFAEATLIERKAITRMLTFMAARSAYRSLRVPWWNVKQHLRYRWAAAMFTTTIDAIERGEHHSRQSEWMIDIADGYAIDAAILRACNAAGRSS